jgi:hypothetical protein
VTIKAEVKNSLPLNLGIYCPLILFPCSLKLKVRLRAERKVA